MKLRAIRKQRGLSQRALAGKARMSQRFLCNIENGLADPSLSTLRRLAKALGVTVGALVDEPQRKR